MPRPGPGGQGKSNLGKTAIGTNAALAIWDKSAVFLHADLCRPESESDSPAAEIAARTEAQIAADREDWADKINKGGIPAGIVRTIVWMAGAGREFDEREFAGGGRTVRESERFADLPLDAFKEMAKDQARIFRWCRKGPATPCAACCPGRNIILRQTPSPISSRVKIYSSFSAQK